MERRPLVLKNSKITQLPIGDTIVGGGGGGEAEIAYEAENKSGSEIKAGQPCAIHSSAVGVVLAGAASSERRCAGVAAESFLNGTSGRILTEGILELDDWTDATGGSLLSPGVDYFLSSASGLLTSTAPSSVSSKVQVIGHALTTTKLDLQIREPILL